MRYDEYTMKTGKTVITALGATNTQEKKEL